MPLIREVREMMSNRQLGRAPMPGSIPEFQLLGRCEKRSLSSVRCFLLSAKRTDRRQVVSAK